MKLLSCLAVVIVLAMSILAEDRHDVDQHGHQYGNSSVKGMFWFFNYMYYLLYSHCKQNHNYEKNESMLLPS